MFCVNIGHRSRDKELPLPFVTRMRSRKKNADLQADTNLNSLIARMSGKCRKHHCSPILRLVLQQPSEFHPPLRRPQQVVRRLPRTCCTYSPRSHNITRTYPNTPSRPHTHAQVQTPDVTENNTRGFLFSSSDCILTKVYCWCEHER